MGRLWPAMHSPLVKKVRMSDGSFNVSGLARRLNYLISFQNKRKNVICILIHVYIFTIYKYIYIYVYMFVVL